MPIVTFFWFFSYHFSYKCILNLLSFCILLSDKEYTVLQHFCIIHKGCSIDWSPLTPSFIGPLPAYSSTSGFLFLPYFILCSTGCCQRDLSTIVLWHNGHCSIYISCTSKVFFSLGSLVIDSLCFSSSFQFSPQLHFLQFSPKLVFPLRQKILKRVALQILVFIV